MDWKKFLKPTHKKIAYTIVLQFLIGYLGSVLFMLLTTIIFRIRSLAFLPIFSPGMLIAIFTSPSNFGKITSIYSYLTLIGMLLLDFVCYYFVYSLILYKKSK